MNTRSEANEPNQHSRNGRNTRALPPGRVLRPRKTLLMFAFWAALALLAPARAAVTLAKDGAAIAVVVRQAGANPAETNALNQLTRTLEQITGATFSVVDSPTQVPASAIIVGPGPAAQKWFPEIDLAQLAPEAIVIRSKGSRLLIAGGRPRGTLYAVNQFLQDQCGVRWWTSWASHIPKQTTLRFGRLDIRYSPPFESRDPFWFPAFDSDWAVKNYSNSQHAHIPEEWGGSINYKGFVHTFYPLVPPEEHFAAHPEWYSWVEGKRTHDNAQLCLSNPQLRDFLTARVKQWLKESPDARIVSVSQNDCHGACQCPECKAVDDREGSHAGMLLDFVNDIAARIEPEFPQVAIDTLAYQYTRKPPKTLKPRPNVIIRLCSIECNFREPLEHKSNAAFADDIRGWAKICDRLYIWDYTTDFGHYMQPHPNWYSLGPNVRFFQEHHVRGLFEQGAYQSFGSEMSEMRAWVLAQLMWNPTRDDRAQIQEFLEGYYGPAAGPIRRYLDLMHSASVGCKVGCFAPTEQLFLRFQPLNAAEQLWREAEHTVANDPVLLARVRLGHLPVLYAWLERWTKLRAECAEVNGTWPLPLSRKAVADQWLIDAHGNDSLKGTRVTLMSESGLTPEKFVERFAQDPPDSAPPAAKQ